MLDDFSQLDPPDDLWDRAVARSQSADPLVEVGPRHTNRRWLAAAAVLVLVAGAIFVGTRDDGAVQVGAAPSTATTAATVISGAGSCAIVAAPDDVTFTPNAAAALYEATTSVSLWLAAPPTEVDDFLGDRTEDVTLADGRSALVVRTASSVEVRVDGAGCGSFSVQASGGPEEQNADEALRVAAGVRTGPTPAGAPKGDLACPLPADRPELLIDMMGRARGTVDGQHVYVGVPMATPDPNAPPQFDTFGAVPVMISDSGGEQVDVRVQPSTAACPSFQVTAIGDNARATALAIAREMSDAALVAPPRTATTIAPDESDVCAGLRVAADVDGTAHYPDASGDLEVGGHHLDVEVTATETEGFDMVSIDDVTCWVRITGDDQATADEVRPNLFFVTEDDHVRMSLIGALWPETAGPAREGFTVPGPERRNPQAVALAFAHEVLGWDGATIGPDQGASDGSAYVVTRVDGAARVEVDVTSAYGGRWFSVVGVRNMVEAGNVSVSVHGSSAMAYCGRNDESSVARFRFDYGGRVAEGLEGETVDLGFSPDTTGSVIGLFVGTDGQVVGACGATLPAGDFAAS